MVNVREHLSSKPRGRIRKTDPKKVVAYIRVSTGKQELGPEAQRASLEAYARAKRLKVVSWHSETVSGAAPLSDRVELFAAIEVAKTKRAGKIIVAKRDRFSRDAFVTELLCRDLKNQGIKLVSTDVDGANGDTPEALLLRRMLDAVAEYERALISARTRAALAVLKKKGLKGPGSIPFGKRLGADGEKLQDDPTEAPVVRRILRERAKDRTVTAIVDGLNADGVPARGGRWHRTTVARILKAQPTGKPE